MTNTSNERRVSKNWEVLDGLFNLLWDINIQHFELNSTPFNTTVKVNLYEKTAPIIKTFQRELEHPTRYINHSICNMHTFYNEYTKVLVITFATS